MGPRSSAALRQLRVPGGAKKDNHRGKLHPDDQADYGGQPAVNNAVRHAANVNSEEHVYQPPQESCDHRTRHDIAHAVFLGPRHTINHRQRQHGKHHGGCGEEEIPPPLQNGVLASFMAWEPASKVPVHPKAAIFHASGPRFTKNSETIPWLPGGKNCVRSAIRSKRLVFPPIRLVASATAISNAGKNARKRLKAMAWEITPHRGKTRANIQYTRLRIPAAEIIARHYSCVSLRGR